MKTSNSIWLFLLIFVFVIGLFLFLNKSTVQDKTQLTLADVSECQSEKIEISVWQLPANTILLNTFISFKSFPLAEELKDKITNWGIALDENSLIFDYLWASIPVEHLCDLVELDEVTSVFTLNK
ncbi:hypothetical protein HOD19_01870 [bacterium]|jgi:heme/copper-type cytochrome/quinol oxidase subunit 2|nr:hypothetical protein [bacterium]MBT4648984.1 hypothetical protein [bacterium]